jgi:mono/diheme cytochrome c family protein
MSGGRLGIIIAAACLGAAVAAARAEEAKSDRAPFSPQVSDFMSETQLSHFKLWFSGSLANWPLARYEIEQMKTSLQLAAEFGAKAYPNFSDLLKSDAEPAFAALDAAIAGKNEAAFITGFERLTKSCNACHTATGLGFIVIQTPTTLPSVSPLSDQKFSP